MEDPGILHASVPTSVVIVVTGVLEDAVVKADATIAEVSICVVTKLVCWYSVDRINAFEVM